MAGKEKAIVEYIENILTEHSQHDPNFEKLSYRTGGDLGTYSPVEITAALVVLSFAFRNEDPSITTHPVEDVVPHGVTEYQMKTLNGITIMIRRELPAVLSLLTMTTQQSGLLHSEWHPLTQTTQ